MNPLCEKTGKEHQFSITNYDGVETCDDCGVVKPWWSEAPDERPRLRDLLHVGDRVQHRSTRVWGSILEISPRGDGSAELRIKYSPNEKHFKGESWWATYHLGAFAVTADDPRRALLASFGHNMYHRDGGTIYQELIIGDKKTIDSWDD